MEGDLQRAADSNDSVVAIQARFASRWSHDGYRILANRDGPKVVVIVNDTSEVHVDAQLMKSGSASLSRVDEQPVEMQNG